MGSRLLPLTLALGVLVADVAGGHGAALYLGLLAVPGAAAAAFVSISDALEGRRALLRSVTSGLALLLLVVASAARENAADGAPLPPLVTYAVAAAVLVYVVPTLAWVLEPIRFRPRPRPRPRAAAVRMTPAP